MSNWDDVGFVQQGWQCPVCGAVYSPTTPMCYNCTGWKSSNIYRTSTGDSVIDWLRRESETKTEEQKEEQ
jgi:uncharacterized OB-fold protein